MDRHGDNTIGRVRRAESVSLDSQSREGWDAAHPGRADPALYREQILPALAQASASRIARATGLSLAYCARIKRGQAIPHARWWETLRKLGK